MYTTLYNRAGLMAGSCGDLPHKARDCLAVLKKSGDRLGSLSRIYIYIYIYIYMCVCVCVCMYIRLPRRAQEVGRPTRIPGECTYIHAHMHAYV